jgi:site-specific recombinase XerD
MLEELQRRNYAQSTIEAYLHGVEDFARHFGKSPELLNQEHIRQYQLYLANERKLALNTIIARIAALRFFFVKTLRRPYQREDLPAPKRPKRLPTVPFPLHRTDDSICDRSPARRVMPASGRRH